MKKIEEIRDMRILIFINCNNIYNNSLFNTLLEKHKDNYSFTCE